MTVQSIPPEQVYQSRSTSRLIDVRKPHELSGELGRIPGAESVPLATVEREAATWGRNAKLVMVCRSGSRSGRAADLLVRLGFPHVMNMTGGMQAYRAAGLPVEEQRSEPVMSKLFPRNEANVERIARVVVTGLVGTCPVYTLLGVSTCSRRAQAA